MDFVLTWIYFRNLPIRFPVIGDFGLVFDHQMLKKCRICLISFESKTFFSQLLWHPAAIFVHAEMMVTIYLSFKNQYVMSSIWY